VALGVAPWPTLVTLVMIPLAWKLMGIAGREVDPAALQPVLRQTAMLHMRFGLLYVLGWVIALWV
jgi:1,4-dihydroxy-2-naphthoate octaprenyltransferase